MSNDKYTGPWAPGMRDIDGGYPFGASLVVSVGAHGLPDRWVLLSEPETIRYTNSRAESEYAWEGCSPDWTDPATVGALSGVVRSLYNEPTMHARPAHVDRISDAEPVIVWYIERAHEDDHEWLRESGAWGSMPDGHRDPPICCDTEHDAWLAAYHAHRDAAGLTANDIEVIRG